MTSDPIQAPPRAYRMRARADAKAETRQRILQATIALAFETLDLEPTLAAIADRAGVSVQTLLRHFSTRDGLLDATVELANGQVVVEREAPAGDIPAAVRILVAHYELRGDFVVYLLASEPGNARVHSIVEPGRHLHRQWVEQVFTPWLGGSPGGDGSLTDLLVVVTDVYAWKLLRRDRGLSREQTEVRMIQLARAVTGTSITETAVALRSGERP